MAKAWTEIITVYAHCEHRYIWKLSLLSSEVVSYLSDQMVNIGRPQLISLVHTATALQCHHGTSSEKLFVYICKNEQLSVVV